MDYNLDILKEEGYYGHVISKKLPKGLDNRLYSMLHLIGGMTTQDVAFFADQATQEEIKVLYRKVRQFPSKINEILPYAGGYKMLLDSPQYQEIIDLVKFGEGEKELVEHSSYPEGGPTDTNPYFTGYINPKLKERLFRLWDSIGRADFESLKLFGVDMHSVGRDAVFNNVSDVLYPVLAIEWLGGVENTEFAKQGWETTSEMGFDNLKFKVEPVGYDYMFDESENFGERGYSCWHIRVLIDVNENASLDDYDRLKELFPESAQNKLSSYRNYTDEQMELIDGGFWEYYHDKASDFWGEFCKVEIKLV
tara:strand:+ start:2885 stop:3808 length:924 start_codon:yes stop_codon:yes gene_type:complete